MAEKTISEGDRRFDASLFDAYAPAQIAKRIETVGLTKAGMETVPALTLGILAGAFISFGAMFYSVVVTETVLSARGSNASSESASSIERVIVVV